LSTALEIIRGSLRKLGVLAAGESLSSEEASDALRSLNSMLSSWNTQNLIMTGLEIEEFSLTSNKGSYTLGSGGELDTSIPVKTDLAFIKDSNNNEFPIELVDNKKWGEIIDKSTTSTYPSKIYIDENYPLRKVYLYPVPSESSTLILHNFRKLSQISALTTSFSLPDGYERAIEYNLCIELAPEYGKSVPAEIMKVANEALANIKRVNIQNRERKVDPALVTGGAFDIRVG
jgi:hypothetical protein